MKQIRIDTEGAPTVASDTEPGVGDVYLVTGGAGGARYLVVVAISGETAYELKFRGDGEVYGVGQSGLHYLRRRTKVGRIREMPDLSIDWFQDPVTPLPCCRC